MRHLSLEELHDWVLGFGVSEYRYRQVADWLYRKHAVDISAMTDLSLDLRARMGARAFVSSLREVSRQVSEIDGTEKFLFELPDGGWIEAVLMRYGRRITLCISSQAGCPLDCVFCQTGRGTFGRNLTAGEIIDQVCLLKRYCADDVDKVNVVFMGMGEPLLNLREMVRAIGILNNADGLDMGSRRITLSTAGIPGRIRRLADAGLRCSLAISLNASSDEQRRELMPALSRYTIRELLDAAHYFYEKNRRRVTFEYVLLAGLNTSDEDAKRLGKLMRGGPFKLNLIPYNPQRDDEFKTIEEDGIQRFIQTVLPDAPTVTVRRSRGPDIDAACGQLWTQKLAEKPQPAKET